MRTIWLASYPKSGNTWMRLLINALSLPEEAPLDINKLPARGGIACGRASFDFWTMIDSGLLTHDEIDVLRPRVYQSQAQAAMPDDDAPCRPVRFVKVHDSYTYLPTGEPLLAGAKGADGAIVIVRDPRDVVPSFAHHGAHDIATVIARMADARYASCARTDGQDDQLRQTLLSWSGHVQSWLDQRDIPVHLVRYEDMQRDTAGVLAEALAFAGFTATPQQIKRAVSLTSFAALKTLEEEKGFAEQSRKAGRFFRRGQAGAWRTELTAQQVAGIEAVHATMMTRLGYVLSGPPQRPATEERATC